MAKSPSLRFGIPTLDRILGHKDGEGNQGHGIWSLCIIGPDGTGKSILAMHVATEFMRVARGGSFRAIYASTDLRYDSANATFHQFALHCPDLRDQKLPAFANPSPKVSSSIDGCPGYTLEHCDPDSVADFLHDDNLAKNKIAFLDLASATAGDDWGYLARMLASLKHPAADQPPHLLIVDAVEGLEFSGEHDAFGELRGRRSRVAQLMRAAHGKACVVLVVEQSKQQRVPEEFATDVVIRLRVPVVGGYRRRTIEIAKARTKDHARGEHGYLIRDGSGSSTGNSPNVDDPWVEHPDGKLAAAAHTSKAERMNENGDSTWDYPMSYLFVCPSIHRRYRDVMKSVRVSYTDPFKDPQHDIKVGFGIPCLDELLDQSDEMANAQRGWPAGRVSAIIGDRGTAKHQLGVSYLAQCFLDSNGNKTPEKDWGVAVLITNRADDSAERLREKISQLVTHKPKGDAQCDEFTKELAKMKAVFCRRLEIHDVSPSVLSHIIFSTIEEAKRQREVFSKKGTPPERPSEPAGHEHIPAVFYDYWRIRLVINDWTILRALYRDLDSDDQFLPYTIFSLNRDRISSLIISTQPGRPNAVIDPADRRFRELQDRQLLTWHVSFSGSRRIAVTHLGRGQRESPVRELRIHDRRPIVDPHFELYTDFDDHPRPVPLRVDMYARYANQQGYIEGVNAFLKGAFTPTIEGGAIAHTFGPDEYAVQQALPFLKLDTRLDHTRVVMLDEFWEAGVRDSETTESPRLLRLNPYLTESLNANVATGLAKRADDPYGSFRVHDRRVDAFLEDWKAQLDPSEPGEVDRVPFTRSFAFLLLHREAWERASDRALPSASTATTDEMPKTVGNVMSSLQQSTSLSWRNFFEACTVVASEWRGVRGEIRPAFSFGLSAEDYSCLVLEIWMSGIRDRVEANGRGISADYRFDSLSQRNAKQRFPNLLDLLEEPAVAEQLYLAALLVAEVSRGVALPLERSRPRVNEPQGTRAHAVSTLPAVAQRTWYAAACNATSEQSWHTWSPRPLPGRFTTRGDWFLGVLAGSRSERLAHRALDLLGGWRSQDARLRAGFGLPTWTFNLAVPTNLWSADQKTLGETPSLTAGARSEGYHRPVPLNYGDVLALGDGGPRNFLWRSQIKRYGLSRTTWHRFLCEFGRSLREIQETRGVDWTSTFSIIGANGEVHGDLNDFTSYRLFKDDWLLSLRAALTELYNAHPTRDSGTQD